MIGKIDLVMWTKNGEKTLPIVLKQIDKVIPHENVCHKILVDDHSTDRTVEIAKSFNWDVYPNPEGGIPSGANEALRYVDRDFFISVEQDVVLAKNWWDKIPPYMQNPKIAVAGGIRVFSDRLLRVISEFCLERSGRVEVSMDNTIYKTQIIKALGGFPNECPICTDTILYKKINWFTPYKWIIDSTVVSVHLRKGMRHELKHLEIMSGKCKHTKLCGCYYIPHFTEPKLIIRPASASSNSSNLTLLRILITSPIRGLHVATKKRCPEIFFVYPLIRLYILRGFLKSERLKG